MSENSICRKFGCSECCKPVKVKRGFKRHVGEDMQKLPFVDKEELWVSEAHPDTVRLEAYDCKLYDQTSGLCLDYDNRPEICKNTKCGAFDLDDEKAQEKMVKKIKDEKFIICKK